MNTKKLECLNALFENEMREDHLRGASVLVYQKGKVWFQNFYGTCKEDTIYKIYSMSKPITAVAAMILYERGQLDLFEPVKKYIPSVGHLKVIDENGVHEAKNEMLVHHLLNMTSGIVYPGEEDLPAKEMAKKQQELLKQVADGKKLDTFSICNALGDCPVAFEPGTQWRYGASADLLAAIVEVISGMKYSEFLKKEIFEPLGMVDTGFTIPKEKIDRFATFYNCLDEEGHLREVDAEDRQWLGITDPTKEPNIESGGGGLYSTLQDYFKFARMLLGKGSFEGKQILGRKTVEFMSENQILPELMKYLEWDALRGFGYGNLMRTKLSNAKAESNGSVGEFGWDGLAGTYFSIVPDEEMVILYMQQHKHGADYSVRRKMRQIIFGAVD
ncbi:beta-lactamase class C and other penicillin binding proteins [Lachnospiraceae bacterium KM106-2]|nr:beta-lactamase class C and other penicillin binding proteins [Lachnospiraceae bacterium KM106-2]